MIVLVLSVVLWLVYRRRRSAGDVGRVGEPTGLFVLGIPPDFVAAANWGSAASAAIAEQLARPDHRHPGHDDDVALGPRP